MTDAERYAGLLAAIDAELKTGLFLSREESRAIADQSGGDFDAADEMVERLERLRTMDRDAAAAWVRARPFDMDFDAFGSSALAGLAEIEARLGRNGRAGVSTIVAIIRSSLARR